jgi:hypothetical protein
MTLFDRIILLATGLVAAYLVWRFYTRWSKEKALHDIYYRSSMVWRAGHLSRPIFASAKGSAPKGFFWVGIGGALIGLGGIALAFLSLGSQFLFFSQQFVLMILAPLLFLMSLAFAWGFMKDIAT